MTDDTTVTYRVEEQLTVAQLHPGDAVDGPGGRVGTFVGASHHPKYLGLSCVVWLMSDGTFSVDALSPDQVVGDALRLAHPKDRAAHLQTVLNRARKAVPHDKH